MNTANAIQINTLDFDLNIDGGPTTKGQEEIQGLDDRKQHHWEESEKSEAPALPQQFVEEVDWLDAVPVEIPAQLDHDNGHTTPVSPTRHDMNLSEIPQLETDTDQKGQFEDIQTYLTHHNTYEESQNIRKEYRKRLLELDDNRYYRDVDCMYETYSLASDYTPHNQIPGPRRMMQELIQTYGRGRGQARRDELHGHQPFGARTHSLQSRIQRKIKKMQRMRQRYANAQ